MRRSAMTLAALAVLLCPADPAPAAWPVPTKLAVTITDAGFMSQGIGGTTDASQLVALRVVKPDGAIMAVGRDVSDASGNFSLPLDYDQRLEPGDRVEITLGGNPDWTYGMFYSRVRLTGIDTAAGTVSGAVTPRKSRVSLVFSGQRVVRDAVDVAKVISVVGVVSRATDPTGRFTVKPTLAGPGWKGGLRRNDLVLVQYRTSPVPGNPAFSFMVTHYAYIPGVQAYIGSNLMYLFGIPGRNYSATLLGPGGAFKGSSRLTFAFYLPLLFFHAPDGSPVSISSGDTISVAGFGGFATLVPPLRAAIATGSDSVWVFGPPNARIRVGASLYDDLGASLPSPDSKWVKTDASGRATVAFPGYDLRVGDRAGLFFIDARGNVWLRNAQRLPVAP